MPKSIRRSFGPRCIHPISLGHHACNFDPNEEDEFIRAVEACEAEYAGPARVVTSRKSKI